jgi:hypothetical protein
LISAPGSAGFIHPVNRRTSLGGAAAPLVLARRASRAPIARNGTRWR